LYRASAYSFALPVNRDALHIQPTFCARDVLPSGSATIKGSV